MKEDGRLQILDKRGVIMPIKDPTDFTHVTSIPCYTQRNEAEAERGVRTSGSCDLLGHSFVTQIKPIRAADVLRLQDNPCLSVKRSCSQDGLTSRLSEGRLDHNMKLNRLEL